MTEETKNFLLSYGTNKRLLSMIEYEKEYFSNDSEPDATCDAHSEEVLIRSRMLEVRRFINNIEDGNCRLMLFYHYIRGFPVEKCAEMMNISRTSGFRLKKKALLLAAQKRGNTAA